AGGDRRLPGSGGGRRLALPMTFLRSLAFPLALVLVTPPSSLLALAPFSLPRVLRLRIITGWAPVRIWLPRRRPRPPSSGSGGDEPLPKRPAVILSKHRSAWETLAFQAIFPPQVLVVKRELLWIPFFGWGLALASPIAIDRSRGPAALKRMIELGRRRLAQGF